MVSLLAASGLSFAYASNGRLNTQAPTVMAYAAQLLGAATTAKTVTVPMIAFIAAASGILIISGVGFLYFKYIRAAQPPPNWQQNASAYSNNNLNTPVDDDAVVVNPSASANTVPGQYAQVNRSPQPQPPGDVPRVSAADAVAQTVLDRLAQPKPVLRYDEPAPMAAMPVFNNIFDTPQHNVPAWQNQLRVSQTEQSEAPKDMFELAKEHPESFGSAQLYQVQQPGGNPENKATND